MQTFSTLSSYKVLVVLSVVLATLFVAAPFAHATSSATWYVSASAGPNGNGATLGTATTTIQAAVDAASSGDIIMVGAGTYAEHVSITKALTLNGANAGVVGTSTSRAAESIVDGQSTDASFMVNTNNVTLDGFTIKNGANGGFNAGVWSTGTNNNLLVQNNIVTNNSVGVFAYCGTNCVVKKNLFDSNNTSAPAGGAAIYSEVSNGLTITQNEFKGHTLNNPLVFAWNGAPSHFNLLITNNSFHNNTYSNIYSFGLSSSTISGNTFVADPSSTGIYFDGGSTDVHVSDNTISGGSYGIRLDDGYSVGNDSAFVINENNITATTNLVQIIGGYTGTLDAVHNYWGMTDEAAITALMSGNIDFKPYYSDSTRTTFFSPVTAANPTVTIGASDTATSSITVASDVSNPEIDFSSLVAGNAVTLPGAINVSASTTGGDFYISMPDGLTITGTTWTNGIFHLPTVTQTSLDSANPPGLANHVSESLEVGLGDTPVTLSLGVRLLFVGKAGSLTGWKQGGVFTEITAACANDSQATGDALAAGADCKIDVGSDLVIWTRHLSSFVTYTQDPNPPTTVSSGGGGGNGAPVGTVGGGSNGGAVLGAAIGPNEDTLGAGTGTGTAFGGEVLGAANVKFNTNLGYGMHSTDVSELQKRLVAEGYSIPDAVTLYFGPQTLAATKAFQKAHGIVQTGFVGVLTRAALNQ